MADEKERRKQMKAFFKQMKGTANFDAEAYAKFNFSESEDEAPAAASKAKAKASAKSNTSQAVGPPSGAVQLGSLGLFELVHARVMLRSAPDTGAGVRKVAKKGTRVQGTPYDVSGIPWLLLSKASCRELNIDDSDTWVLMDGRSVGLGQLVRPVESESVQTPSAVTPEPVTPEAAIDPSVKLVSMLTFSVTGAASGACNGKYVFEGNHKGKALYKSSTGAIVYFNGIWKMSSTYKVTACNYSAQGLPGEAGPLPPLGRWIAEGSGKLGPTVRVTGERLQVVSEKGPQMKLEDGRTVTKSQENKVWCWASVIEEMEGADEEHARQVQKVQEAALKEAAKVAPPAKNDLKALANPMWMHEQRAAQEAEATGEEMPSMEDLLDSIDRAEEAEDEAPDAPSSAAAVPSIDELLKSLDQEEEADAGDGSASRDLFFELGRRPTTAIMQHGGAGAGSWNAQLHGGVATGRGAEFNFRSFGVMGASMVQELRAKSEQS